MVQWFRFCTSTAGGTGSISSKGTKIQHVAQCCQKIFFNKLKKYINENNNIISAHHIGKEENIYLSILVKV